MKKIIFITMILLLAQTVFAEERDTQEIAFLVAYKKNDLSAMEKALKERTSKTNLDVLLYSIVGADYNDFSLPSVQLLIKYGANCNVKSSYAYSERKDDIIVYHLNEHSRSVLALAITNYKYTPNNTTLQIIKLLLESGADMYPRNIWESDILLCEDKYIALARLLIEKGYDINSFNSLIEAIKYGSYRTVRLLIESGAKVNQQDNSGKTAAQIAYEKGEIDIYNYLKQNGAVWTAPSQVASAPSPSSQPRQTYNDNYDYSPPPSSSSSSSTPSRNVGKEIADAFIPPLDSGTYGLSGTQAKIRLTGIATSGMLSYTNRQGKTVNGYYNINGNTMTVQADGFTYVYTITSKTSFSGHGETWVRTGY